MKTALHPIEHLGKFERLQLVEDLWDEFASESASGTRRDGHPNQGKSLSQIVLSLGVYS